MKKSTKIVISLTIVLYIIYGIYGYNHKQLIKNELLSNKKIELLKDEINKIKISTSEKELLKEVQNNNMLKSEEEIALKELEELLLLKKDKAFLIKCSEEQIKRLIDNKKIDSGYCNKKLQGYKQEITTVEEVLEIQGIKQIRVIQEPKAFKSSISVDKSYKLLCQEVNNEFLLKADINRCASYMSMVYGFESNYGKSTYCNNYNNCFGLKVPTNKKGLKGNWSVGKGRFLIFETKEMGNFAFAYYYQRYHTSKGATRFVNTYSDGNKNYTRFLLNNYKSLYNKYKEM